jgi:hypothetical protein
MNLLALAVYRLISEGLEFPLLGQISFGLLVLLFHELFQCAGMKGFGFGFVFRPRYWGIE